MGTAVETRNDALKVREKTKTSLTSWFLKFKASKKVAAESFRIFFPLQIWKPDLIRFRLLRDEKKKNRLKIWKGRLTEKWTRRLSNGRLVD